MTDSLGHSNNFAILSLSLSLSLRYSPTIAYTLLRHADTRVNIYGFSCIPAREAALFFIPATEYIKYFKDNRHHDEM